MPITRVAGQSLFYQDCGKGFPVVLAHGYLWNSHMWAPQIAALSQSYRVVVPDLWGHGQSGPLPSNTQSFVDISAQMTAFLDSLGIEQCAIVGLSVGGMWSAELALTDPNRVRALILMDTDLGLEPNFSRRRYLQMLDHIGNSGSIPLQMLDAIVPLFFRIGGPRDTNLATAFRRKLSAFSSSQLRDSIVPLGKIIFGRPEANHRLSKLDPTRTLVMCGSEDRVRPPAETVHMAQIIGCQYVLVPGAGHISNLENPAFVSSTIYDWFSRQLPNFT